LFLLIHFHVSIHVSGMDRISSRDDVSALIKVFIDTIQNLLENFFVAPEFFFFR